VLVAQGKVDEAEPHLQEAMTLLREGATAKPELTAQAANWLGVIRIGRNAYPEAEALMLPGSDRFFATNAAGYFLQETMNLGSPTNWITLNDPFPPVIVNGQFRVTRPMLGPQYFYRLAQ